jgi:type I restriction enzyme S subunit
MFGDPVANEKSWPTISLDDACDGIGDGLHGTPEYDDSGEYPFINGNNLIDGTIKITPATKMVDEETYIKHYIEITENAILISINGTLGKMALYNGEKVMLGKSACYCNLKPTINREFVYELMKSDKFAGFLEGNSTKSTIKNVGLKAIRGFQLILPPDAIQMQFVEFARQVDKSKVAVQKSLDETRLLFDSLMQEYFG